ncbi:MAG: EamA family transporter, partial [Pseudopedobacter saltans]
MSRNASPSTIAVVVAFAIVYIVWGSTYFFIQNALKGFTPFLMGTFRFLTAGLILLSWCAFKKFPIFDKHTIGVATVSGLLLLFLDNGIFIWAEQYLPSSLAAIMASGVSLWFIVLD